MESQRHSTENQQLETDNEKESRSKNGTTLALHPFRQGGVVSALSQVVDENSGTNFWRGPTLWPPVIVWNRLECEQNFYLYFKNFRS